MTGVFGLQTCPVCLWKQKDLAFGCGHQVKKKTISSYSINGLVKLQVIFFFYRLAATVGKSCSVAPYAKLILQLG